MRSQPLMSPYPNQIQQTEQQLIGRGPDDPGTMNRPRNRRIGREFPDQVPEAAGGEPTFAWRDRLAEVEMVEPLEVGLEGGEMLADEPLEANASPSSAIPLEFTIASIRSSRSPMVS